MSTGQNQIKLLAKPTGILLEDHVKNLLRQTEIALKMRPFVVRKYREMTGEDFASAVKQSARWHDEGKKHSLWQNACQKDFDIYQAFSNAQKKSLPINWAKHIQKAGIRHELASLEIIYRLQANVSLPVRVAVAAHHGKLSEKHEHRWSEHNEFQKFWDEFYELGHSFQTGEKGSFEKAILERYRFAGPRAWLQMVDSRASAFEDGQELPPLGTFSYNFPWKGKERGVQKLVKEIWDEPFAILRAPTGAGKTDTALLWANHQIEAGRADRLVFAMPTRFTANSLSISTIEKNFENLGDAGLYHSSAWYQRVKDKKHPTRKEQAFINKEQKLARNLETPFTVTTIDHLCICLTGTREDHHSIFFGLAHSCVVIDEADFYDNFTQQNIVTLLRALLILKVPVLLMSATVPESARKTYSKSGFTTDKIHSDETDADRSRCVIKRYGKAEKPEEIEELLEMALEQPTIIYANTVSRAQAYYYWIKSRDFDDVVLYHSRFIEPHKVEKENRLRKMLGRNAWKKGKQHGIAILTQIGEISVNISADFMISDLCPLDRLAQRVGRLSRFSKFIGEVFIIEPQKTNKNGITEFYPAPYGSFNPIFGWQISEALAKSKELLNDGKYSAKDFVNLVNRLYPNEDTIEPHIIRNVRALEDMIVTNWLILPKQLVENDDDQTKEWKSRDIPFQQTIFVGFDDSGLDNNYFEPTNKTELKEFEIRYGIPCYVYEYNQAAENSIIELKKFQIGYDEIVERPVIRIPLYYNEHVGLDLRGGGDN